MDELTEHELGRPINFDRLIIFPFSTRTLPFLCRRVALLWLICPGIVDILGQMAQGIGWTVPL